MKPSDKIKKPILEFLMGKNNQVSPDVFREMISSVNSQGFSIDKVLKVIEQMDNVEGHENLLQIELQLPPGGGLNISGADEWLAMKGEDYLDNLNNSKEDKPVSQSFTVNGDNVSIGNNNRNSFSDDHSNNVAAQIDKLLSYKNKLDPADQATLEQFAENVQRTLASQEKPKQGALSKFSDFLDKTWNTISPVATPLLVELAKRALF